MDIMISTEFIKLDQFLKFSGAVETGGEAKIVISEGLVLVNGEVETKRGRKIKKGDKITVEDLEFNVC